MRFSTVNGCLPGGVVRYRPAVGKGFRFEERRSRHLKELAALTYAPVSPSSSRVPNSMLNTVALKADAATIDARLGFDLSLIADRPTGWGRPKTAARSGAPLYRQTLDNPGSLRWVSRPDRFPAMFREFWARLLRMRGRSTGETSAAGAAA